MKATEVTAGLAESNSRLLLGIWRDSLHVTCGLTACTPGSAPGPTLGNEYGKTFTFTQVSRYQKGKTNLDFTEARDSEWQWHQLGHMQVCTLLPTDNHAKTPPLSFLQSGCPCCRPANSVKALKAPNCWNFLGNPGKCWQMRTDEWPVSITKFRNLWKRFSTWYVSECFVEDNVFWTV